jgi:hypothetical protein
VAVPLDVVVHLLSGGRCLPENEVCTLVVKTGFGQPCCKRAYGVSPIVSNG